VDIREVGPIVRKLSHFDSPAYGATAAWVTLFLKGATSVVQGCLEEGVKCWIARDLKSIVSRSQLKHQMLWVNS